jgi:hypothetical protein
MSMLNNGKPKKIRKSTCRTRGRPLTYLKTNNHDTIVMYIIRNSMYNCPEFIQSRQTAKPSVMGIAVAMNKISQNEALFIMCPGDVSLAPAGDVSLAAVSAIFMPP